MLFILISIIVPISIYLSAPFLLARITKRPARLNGLLLFGCILFFASWYLPSPLIQGKDTALTTHLVGGGIFSGILWLYIKENLDWKSSNLVEFISLYAFTSTLGVLNELFELVIVILGISRLSLTDTSWDLAANTLGMLLFWIAYKLVTPIVRSK